MLGVMRVLFRQSFAADLRAPLAILSATSNVQSSVPVNVGSLKQIAATENKKQAVVIDQARL